MTDKPDNPQAFPTSSIDGFTQDGMTLRDYFAGQALAGLCSRTMDVSWFDQHGAKGVYGIADAMLKARETD